MVPSVSEMTPPAVRPNIQQRSDILGRTIWCQGEIKKKQLQLKASQRLRAEVNFQKWQAAPFFNEWKLKSQLQLQLRPADETQQTLQIPATNKSFPQISNFSPPYTKLCFTWTSNYLVPIPCFQFCQYIHSESVLPKGAVRVCNPQILRSAHMKPLSASTAASLLLQLQRPGTDSMLQSTPPPTYPSSPQKSASASK